MSKDFQNYIVKSRNDFCKKINKKTTVRENKEILTSIDDFLIAYDNLHKEWLRMYANSISVTPKIVSVENSKK